MEHYMNGYIAFYRGKQVEVYAVSSYEAASPTRSQ
jgi:hypothetical protein